MLWALYDVPLEARAGNSGPSLLIEAANGDPVGRVGTLADTVGRQDFPEVLIKAVLSIEDRRFYSHWAVDPQGIARAAYALRELECGRHRRRRQHDHATAGQASDRRW